MKVVRPGGFMLQYSYSPDSADPGQGFRGQGQARPLCVLELPAGLRLEVHAQGSPEPPSRLARDSRRPADRATRKGYVSRARTRAREAFACGGQGMAGTPWSAGRLTVMSSVVAGRSRHPPQAASPQRGQLAAASRRCARRTSASGTSTTWSDCRDQVRLAGARTDGAGRCVAARSVALIGRNRPNWVWGELAAQCARLHDPRHLRGCAGGRGWLPVSRRRRRPRCCARMRSRSTSCSSSRAPDLRLIVYHDDRGMANRDDPRLVAWARLQALGRELFERQPGAFEAEVAQGRGEDVAILCTTSGTTAQPKLAMLQHRPFLDHIAAYLRADPRLAHRRVRLDPAAAVDHGAGLRGGDAAAVPDPGELPGEPGDGDARPARDRPYPHPAGATGMGADRGRHALSYHGRWRA